jgi:multiple sugar transport system permease protein
MTSLRGTIWPASPTLDSFYVVVTEGFWYLEHFWHQFGNSFFVGLMTMCLTLLIGSLASFAVGRMRLRNGWLLTNAALMTYVIPASFLAIPFYRIMQIYGLTNHLWAVIAAITTFATPYAIFIFSQYGKSIPMELDESARIDGQTRSRSICTSTCRSWRRARCSRHLRLAARLERISVQFPDASTPDSMTVAVALAQFLNSDESPWNLMMATALVYALPPIMIYYMFRRNMAAGLTMGGVKGLELGAMLCGHDERARFCRSRLPYLPAGRAVPAGIFACKVRTPPGQSLSLFPMRSYSWPSSLTRSCSACGWAAGRRFTPCCSPTRATSTHSSTRCCSFASA